MAGTLTISTLSDGTNSTSSTNCIQGSAKAWVNFNGTNSSGAIRKAYNVSSVTYNSQGLFTVNFTTALADKEYSLVGTGNQNLASGATVSIVMPIYNNCTASAAALQLSNVSQQSYPLPIVCIAVFD